MNERRRKWLPAASVAGWIAGCAPATQPPGSQPPSHLFVGGTIRTLESGRGAGAESSVEALAIREDRIVALGGEAELRSLADERTLVVDLAGATLLPGFVDHHIHLVNIGLSIARAERLPDHYVDLSGVTSIEEVAERVAERASRLPEGTWILGQGWSQGAWSATELPHHEALSAAAPHHPVLLARLDAHAAWVNALALELAGIGPSTPDPPGGGILRDAEGRPTGVLLERAVEPVLRLVPAPTDAEIERAFRLGARALAAHGVTAAFDAGFLAPPGLVDYGLDFERYLDILVRTARAERLPLDLGLMIPAPSAIADRMVATSPDERTLAPGLTVTHLKMFADGALGSRGALLSAPYADDPTTVGVSRMTTEEIRRQTLAAIDAGLDVAVHAIGDLAIVRTLDAFEGALRERPGVAPARLRLEHFSAPVAADVERGAALGIVISGQPDFVIPDAGGAAMEDSRLAERAEHAYPWASLARLGARLVFGTDSFDELPRPLATPFCAATRLSPFGGASASWHPGERLEALTALRLSSTLAPAGGEELVGGQLVVGGRADFVLLDRDPLTTPAEDWIDIAVVGTYRGGVAVH